MNSFGGYTTVKVGEISPAKLRKALDGAAVRLSSAELTGDRVMVVNKLNAKAIKTAKLKGKGLTTHFTTGEVKNDLDYHDSMGGSLNGGSLWSWLRDKAAPWVKKNWNVLKPVVSRIADVAIPAAATFFGQPTAGVPARTLLKSMTGVSVGSKPKKGSPEMAARMAALRAKRKTGGSVSAGSFRMP